MLFVSSRRCNNAASVSRSCALLSLVLHLLHVSFTSASPPAAPLQPLRLVSWGGSLDGGALSLRFNAPVAAGSLDPTGLALMLGDNDNTTCSVPFLAEPSESAGAPCWPLPPTDGCEVLLPLTRREVLTLRARLAAAPAGTNPRLSVAAGTVRGVRGGMLPSVPATALPPAAPLLPDKAPPEAVGFALVPQVAGTGHPGSVWLELWLSEPAAPFNAVSLASVDGLQLCFYGRNDTCVSLHLPRGATAVSLPDNIETDVDLRMRFRVPLAPSTITAITTTLGDVGRVLVAGDDVAAAVAGRALAADAALHLPGGTLIDVSGNIQFEPTCIAPARAFLLRSHGPRLLYAFVDTTAAQLRLVFDTAVAAETLNSSLLRLDAVDGTTSSGDVQGNPIRIFLDRPMYVVSISSIADADAAVVVLEMADALLALLVQVLAPHVSAPTLPQSTTPASATQTSTLSRSTSSLSTTSTSVDMPLPYAPALWLSPSDMRLTLLAGGVAAAVVGGVGLANDTSQRNVTAAKLFLVADVTPPLLTDADVDLTTGILTLTLSEPVFAQQVRPARLVVMHDRLPTTLPLATTTVVHPTVVSRAGRTLAWHLDEPVLAQLRTGLLGAAGNVQAEQVELHVDCGFAQDSAGNANVAAKTQLRLVAGSDVLGPGLVYAKLQRVPSSASEGGEALLVLEFGVSMAFAPESLQLDRLELRVSHNEEPARAVGNMLRHAALVHAGPLTVRLDITALWAVVADAQQTVSADGSLPILLLQALPQGLENEAPAFTDTAGRGNKFTQVTVDVTEADFRSPTITDATLQLPASMLAIRFSEPVLLAGLARGGNIVLWWTAFVSDNGAATAFDVSPSPAPTLNPGLPWLQQFSANVSFSIANSLAMRLKELSDKVIIDLPAPVRTRLTAAMPVRAWLIVDGVNVVDASGNAFASSNTSVTISAATPRVLQFAVVDAATLQLVFSVPVAPATVDVTRLGLQTGGNSTRGAEHSQVAYVALGSMATAALINATVSGI